MKRSENPGFVVSGSIERYQWHEVGWWKYTRSVHKAKRHVSKRVLQENKAYQIFPLFVFRKIWSAFFFSRNTRFEIRAFVALPTKCLFDELSKFIILLMFFSHKEPTWKPIQVCTVQHVESLFWVDQSYFAYTEKTQKVIIIFQSCVTCRMKATKLHQWRMKLFFQNNVINVSFNAIQIIKTVNYPASFYFDLFLYSTYGVLSWNLISDYMFSEEYEKKYVLVFPN